MESNKNVMALVKLAALLLLLVGLTATVVDARASSFNQRLAQAFVKSPPEEACCDNCICTRSNPPICQCRDKGEFCHSACKLCICVHLYWPLRLECSCADETDFCYPPCTPELSSGTELPQSH